MFCIIAILSSCKPETEYVDKKADETVPANVTDLAAQAKDSRVLLTWTDAADEDVYGYEVTYSGTNPINRVVLPALDSKTMMAGKGAGGCYVSGLENGTEYTFVVKTVDTSGNKSEGVNVKATPVADASEPLKIELAAAVPQENGYTGNKSNTKVTVTAKITTASKVKKVVWKKNGSLIAKELLADNEANDATPTENDAVWTFDITAAAGETANGIYTVAAIDEAGREEAEQIMIDNFDFTAPGKVKVPTKPVYSSDLSSIKINWIEPDDADYDHVDITFTSNDGISNSEPSEAVSVKKGTLTKTFSDIDGAKAYYTYTFVTYDELGNKGAEYIRLVSLNKAISNIPEGFVEVPGIAITGTENWTPASRVFVSGRTLNIEAFLMSDHEVTRGEYKEIMGSDPSRSKDYGTVDNNPVKNVSWYDAIVYCNRRSKKEGLTSCYTINGSTDPDNWGDVSTKSDDTWNAATCDFTANGYRLPTEAEWEWAARGGENYTYAGSDNIDDVAWYTENTNNTGTREVKTKKPNGYGLYDMSGNVCEWCWDRYSDSISGSTPEAGASSGSARVLRGGSWYDGDNFCKFAFRGVCAPAYSDNDLGFRVVRSAQ